MANFNKVFLIGNLTRDPELRYLPSGTAVATFTTAVNRNYTLQTGEKKQESTFIRIVVWGRRAEVCGEYLNKGSAVFIEGRLQSRSWEGQDGQKRNTVEIVADNVQFLGKSKRPAAQGEVPPNQAAQQPLDIIPDVDIAPDVAKKEGQETEDEVPF